MTRLSLVHFCLRVQEHRQAPVGAENLQLRGHRRSYGTLRVDPIATAGELGRVLGDTGGGEAARLWPLKQLEYSFRLTAMGCYEDFRWVTSRALDFALASVGERLPDGQPSGSPGSITTCSRSRTPSSRCGRGVRVRRAVQRGPAMMASCLANSGLAGFFGQRVSVDEVRVFKPSPVVYRHAAERLSLPVGQVRLVTSNVFDSVGASAAWMCTAWVSRSAALFDTIGAQPDLIVPALDRLPAALAG
jgi:2-haloacid dehalogenase